MRNKRLLFFATLALSLVSASATHAQLTPGEWMPAPGETAQYCVDGACSQEIFDASIVLYESLALGLLSAEVTVSFAPAGSDIPVVIGNTLSLGELPYAVSVSPSGTPSDHAFDFEFVTADFLTLSGFVVIDDPPLSLPLLEVNFDQVEFVPVPEPSHFSMLLAAVLTVSIVSRRSRSV